MEIDDCGDGTQQKIGRQYAVNLHHPQCLNRYFLHCTSVGSVILSMAWKELTKKYVSSLPPHLSFR